MIYHGHLIRRGYLKAEYEGEVSENNLLESDPYKVLMGMTKRTWPFTPLKI